MLAMVLSEYVLCALSSGVVLTRTSFSPNSMQKTSSSHSAASYESARGSPQSRHGSTTPGTPGPFLPSSSDPLSTVSNENTPGSATPGSMSSTKRRNSNKPLPPPGSVSSSTQSPTSPQQNQQQDQHASSSAGSASGSRPARSTRTSTDRISLATTATIGDGTIRGSASGGVPPYDPRVQKSSSSRLSLSSSSSGNALVKGVRKSREHSEGTNGVSASAHDAGFVSSSASPSRLPVFRVARTAASPSQRYGASVNGSVLESDDGHVAGSEGSSLSGNGTGASQWNNKKGFKSSLAAKSANLLRSLKDTHAKSESGHAAWNQSGHGDEEDEDDTGSNLSRRAPIAAQFAYALPNSQISTSTAESSSHPSLLSSSADDWGRSTLRARTSVTPDTSAASLGASLSQPSSIGRARGTSPARSVGSVGRSAGSSAKRTGISPGDDAASSSGMTASKTQASSASQRLQRTTITGASKPSITSSIPKATAPNIPSRNHGSHVPTKGDVFVSMSTAGTVRAPASSSSSSTTTHGGAQRSRAPPAFDKEKDLPPRPKSSLAGFFSRASSVRTSSIPSSNSMGSVRAAALPAPTKSTSSSRPGSALGMRLKGLTTRAQPMTTTVNDKGRLSAAPGKTVGTGPAGRLGDVKARVQPMTQMKPSNASKRKPAPSITALEERDSALQRASVSLPASPRAQPSEAHSMTFASSVSSHSPPASPPLGRSSRPRSIFGSVFEPSDKSSFSHASSNLAQSDSGHGHGRGSQISSEAHTPGSPRGFSKVGISVRQRTSSRHDLINLFPDGSSAHPEEILQGSAIEDDTSEAGHSNAHSSYGRPQEASSRALNPQRMSSASSSASHSRRTSWRLPSSFRGMTSSRAIYTGSPSASTSPRISSVDVSSDGPHMVQEQSFQHTATHRVPRSRESSVPFFPLEVPSSSSSIDHWDSLSSPPPLSTASSFRHEFTRPPGEFGLLTQSALSSEVSNSGVGTVEEDEPLPPPRSSSKSAGRTLSTATLGPTSRPELKIDTAVPLVEGPKTEDLLLANRGSAFLRDTEIKSRKGSQPSLSMADDLEFLKALEEVRRLHRERILRLNEEESARLLGKESGQLRPPEDARSRVNSSEQREPPVLPAKDLVRSKPRPRANSASGSLGGFFSVQSMPFVTQDALDRQKPLDTERLFDLPLQVGRTAGKGQGGAFDNDDDWKKEVKALFGESCPTPLFWRVFR